MREGLNQYDGSLVMGHQSLSCLQFRVFLLPFFPFFTIKIIYCLALLYPTCFHFLFLCLFISTPTYPLPRFSSSHYPFPAYASLLSPLHPLLSHFFTFPFTLSTAHPFLCLLTTFCFFLSLLSMELLNPSLAFLPSQSPSCCSPSLSNLLHFFPFLPSRRSLASPPSKMSSSCFLSFKS